MALGLVSTACGRATPASPDPATANITWPLSGVYRMTVDIGEACPGVPPADRIRQYTAQPERRGADTIVTLSGSRFLTGLICTAGSGRFAGVGCHQLFATSTGETVTFALENNNDESHGGHIVEQSSSGAWLEILGRATGRLGGPTVEAVGAGSVWYCPTPLVHPFPCSAFVSCPATDLRVTLRR